MKKNFQVIFTLLIISVISFALWGVVRTVKAIQFDHACIQYIKRAADASSIELAKEELGKAIEYCEENNLTEGTVSIFFKQPQNDVGYWYKNLTTAYAELESLTDEVSSIERTNMLMKIRETLTDDEEDGVQVTHPEGISVYPNNVSYFWWSIISLIGAALFLFLGASY